MVGPEVRHDGTDNVYVMDAIRVSKVNTASTQPLGFWGVTPVTQQATATVSSDGFSAANGTAVLDGSTFTGGYGSKAYHISDIVLALKQCGIMVSA